MANTFYTVNLEEGRPLVHQAIAKMRIELSGATMLRAKAVKLIHGYGSSGTGGGIRIAVRKELDVMKRQGKIKAWVPGETWEIFNPEAIRLLDACNDLRSDRDLGRYNNGVTLVLL